MTTQESCIIRLGDRAVVCKDRSRLNVAFPLHAVEADAVPKPLRASFITPTLLEPLP
jgi:hypothetical protein